MSRISRIIGKARALEEAAIHVKKGAFHAWLGKSPDEKITKADIAKGKAAGGHAEKMAIFAQNFGHIGEETLDENRVPKGHTIEAYGVKGMQSKSWRKTFKHAEHLNDWAEKNDAEVHGTRDLEQATKGNLSPAMKEETINELSKKTLGRYIKKATGGLNGAAAHAHTAGQNLEGGRPSLKHWNKAVKRIKGVEKATDRLTNEEMHYDLNDWKEAGKKHGAVEFVPLDKHVIHAKDSKGKVVGAWNHSIGGAYHADVTNEETIDESLRKVSEHEYRGRKAVVYRNPEHDEWQVKFHHNGQHLKDADSFHSDKEDAQGTARHWISHAHPETNESTLDEAGNNPHHDAAGAHKARKMKRAERMYSKKTMKEGFAAVLAEGRAKLFALHAVHDESGHSKHMGDFHHASDAVKHINHLEDSGKWPEGHEAILTHKKSGQKAYCTDKWHPIHEETLDELSKKTLGRYIKKATGGLNGAAAHAHTAGQNLEGGRPSLKHWNKAVKRIKGVEKATDRLTNEEKILEHKREMFPHLTSVVHGAWSANSGGTRRQAADFLHKNKLHHNTYHKAEDELRSKHDGKEGKHLMLHQMGSDADDSGEPIEGHPFTTKALDTAY